jgi:hypothetical protein
MLFSPDQHRKMSGLLRAKAQEESDPEKKAGLIGKAMIFAALAKMAKDPAKVKRQKRPSEPSKPRMKGLPPIKA